MQADLSFQQVISKSDKLRSRNVQKPNAVSQVQLASSPHPSCSPLHSSSSTSAFLIAHPTSLLWHRQPLPTMTATDTIRTRRGHSGWELRTTRAGDGRNGPPQQLVRFLKLYSIVLITNYTKFCRHDVMRRVFYSLSHWTPRPRGIPHFDIARRIFPITSCHFDAARSKRSSSRQTPISTSPGGSPSRRNKTRHTQGMGAGFGQVWLDPAYPYPPLPTHTSSQTCGKH